MRRSAIFWGSLLILAGVLFLLQNLNIISGNIWSLLWPLLIIAVGIFFLFGVFSRRSVKAEHVNVPLEGASRAQLRIRHGAGRLGIRSGAGAGDLLEGDFGGGLELSSRRDGDVLNTTLSVPSQNFPFWGSWGESLDWSMGIKRDIPLSLDLETGANESHIDLSDLLVTDLRLKSGASSTVLTMPVGAGFTRADVQTGAASVRITIPPGVAAHIRARGGLASVTINEARFPRMGDGYQSADYETAANKADLNIETGVGSIDVR
jgi:hypothetical protein